MKKRKTPCQKSQFHHDIPRFVLKKFISKSDSEKARLKAPGRYGEFIHCYSTTDISGEPIMRSISKVYGAEDLYKDTRTPGDPYALELELSGLESQVSKTISLILGRRPKARGALGGEPAAPTTFRTKRKNFNSLQKFLYIMGYRKASIAETYWQQDHPEDARFGPWIRSFIDQNKTNPTPVDIWIYQLGYLLRTSHEEIVEHGRNEKRKSARQVLEHPHSLWRRKKDPGLKNLDEYMAEADGCFLAIWEAAPGEEFIISSNSFGILEGKRSDWGPIHRFYVISPKVALVICSIGLDPDFDGDLEIRELCRGSMLQHAIHKSPKVIHAVDPPKFQNSREKLDFEARSHTRLDDMMEFEVSTLSIEHTHIINAIILKNVNDGGMITFRCKKAFIQTLSSFSENRYFSNHNKYDLLLKRLQEVESSVRLKTPPESEEESHSDDGNYGEPDQDSPSDNHAYYLELPLLLLNEYSKPKTLRNMENPILHFIKKLATPIKYSPALVFVYFLSFILIYFLSRFG